VACKRPVAAHEVVATGQVFPTALTVGAGHVVAVDPIMPRAEPMESPVVG
jgi:hypothetical protein